MPHGEGDHLHSTTGLLVLLVLLKAGSCKFQLIYYLENPNALDADARFISPLQQAAKGCTEGHFTAGASGDTKTPWSPSNVCSLTA